MQYKLAIFDMDGTILSTLDDLADSLNHILKTAGYPTHTLQEVEQFVGNGILKLIERAVPKGTDTSCIEQLFQEFIPYYQNHCAIKTKPYDGIPALLENLCSHGCKTAVVSNKADAAVKELCRVYFNGLFDISFGERPGIPKKPAPDSIHEVLQILKIDPKDAVYIGDSEVDLQTAKNSGLDVIMVNWGFRSTEFLQSCGADTIVSTPQEIAQRILKK